MKSGIYALASLDGSPLNREDLELLGLASPHKSSAGRSLFSGRAVDELIGGQAIDQVEDGPEQLLFCGYLNEPEEALALAGAPAPVGSARLTQRLLTRFGGDAAWHLLGDYSFVGWNDQARELTLFNSQRIRDQLYWATNGKHIAVSPDILLLTKLPWVGRTIDTTGFALSVSIYRLRRIRTTETMWSGVSRLPAGWSARFHFPGNTTTRLAAEPQVRAWGGTFDEAVEELTHIGRRIIGQQMARYVRTAFLLSGGLDSSLTTVLGSVERQRPDAMFCLTSVAPEGSGIADEWLFSKAVADAVDVPLYPVEADSKNLFRSSPTDAAHFGVPDLGLRQHLYEKFEERTREACAQLITEGVGGEFTVSAPRYTAKKTMLRRAYELVRQHLRRETASTDLKSAFLVRLQPRLIGTFPEHWAEVLQEPVAEEFQALRKGFSPTLPKTAERETSGVAGLRYFFPYYDHRLTRFAAGLPNRFFIDRQQDRKLARAMLRDYVPAAITHRRSGLPISPTYLRDLRSLAPIANARIPNLRKSGIAEYLDLNWLSTALDRLGSGANPYFGELYQAQISCRLAEFLQQVLDGTL